MRKPGKKIPFWFAVALVFILFAISQARAVSDLQVYQSGAEYDEPQDTRLSKADGLKVGLVGVHGGIAGTKFSMELTEYEGVKTCPQIYYVHTYTWRDLVDYNHVIGEKSKGNAVSDYIRIGSNQVIRPSSLFLIGFGFLFVGGICIKYIKHKQLQKNER